MNTLSDRLARSFRQDAQDMHAYAVQPSAGFVKVDTMENPFLVGPEILDDKPSAPSLITVQEP